ncbi:phosphoethanolamine transferase [Dyella sp. RRB7]|uniref:phosphoethanolamine transferase n=1 Tax=Dyella sp. RRB7 TaxID=2919502 RepID=UPI001FAAC856|nr:phosphoethanolamine transferase [Dyella sp. RRB7]
MSIDSFYIDAPPRRSYVRLPSLIGLASVCALPSLTLALKKAQSLEWDQTTVILSSTFLSLFVLTAAYSRLPRLIVTVLTILAIIGIGEVAFIREYGWTFDANSISLLLETNRAEASDFFSSLPSFLLLSFTLPAILGYLAWPESRAYNRLWRPRLLVYSVITWIAITCIAGLPTMDNSGAQASTPVFPMEKRGQDKAIEATYPTGLPWVIYSFLNERRALVSAISRDKDFRFTVHPPVTNGHRRFYVLVIGETSRADHWGLNGYQRDTTPELSQRGDVVSFKRMYTPWPFTRLAVPLMISRKPSTIASPAFAEASIVTVFKQAGFRTSWISLQAPVGFHDSPISTYAYESDDVRFLNPVDYRYEGKHDDAAVAELRQLIDAPNQKDNFVVIHTLGSHFRYTDRYPRTFAKFTPDDPNGTQAQLFNRNDKQVLINGYDNTILFTDHVLSSLINELARHENMESWLLYSSDHGEALFDDCRMQSGHGQFSKATQHPAALFWPSPLYKKLNQDKVSLMQSRRDMLASTDMFFETMTDLAGITVDGNRPNNSLLSVHPRLPNEIEQVEVDFKCPAGKL